jgi:hypothetical protein
MLSSTGRKILILATLLVLASTLMAQDANSKPFIGDWNGNISIAGMEIEITIHFTMDADKKFAGTIDVPQQGAAGLILADFKWEGKTLNFTINGIPSEPPLLKATVDETGKKMTGTINQNGMDGSFALARVEK